MQLLPCFETADSVLRVPARCSSLPILQSHCTFSPLVHTPATHNQISHFLVLPAAIQSSDNQSTLQLIILFIELGIEEHLLKRSHRYLLLQTAVRGQIGHLKSFSSPLKNRGPNFRFHFMLTEVLNHSFKDKG